MEITRIEQHFCHTTWGRVCYWVNSSSKPLPVKDSAKINLTLFLHGVGGSGRYWFSYLQELALAANPFIAVAPDLLGFGASAKPAIDYSREIHLDVIEATLEDYLHSQTLAQVNTIELELVGHSMGGILAILLADRLLTNKAIVKPNQFHLTKLVLLGTPYASPKHDLKNEILRSPLNRAMLSHPLICETVHHSFKLFWPLVLILVRKRWVNLGLPFPVVADYMEHTCRSYTSSVHHIIFETNLDPTLRSLQEKSHSLLPTLLVYSRADEEVSWQHGQELAGWFKASHLELLEQASHQGLGQAALQKVLAFLR